MSLYSLWIGKCPQPSLCTLRLCTYWGCDSVWICTSTSDKHDQKWTSSSFLWKARILQFSAQLRNFPIWPKLLRNYVFSADKENCNFSIMDSFWAAGNIPPLPAFIFPDFGFAISSVDCTNLLKGHDDDVTRMPRSPQRSSARRHVGLQQDQFYPLFMNQL